VRYLLLFWRYELWPIDEIMPTLPKNHKNGNIFELFTEDIMREYRHVVESRKAVS